MTPPSRPCGEPGCPTLGTTPRCPVHRRRDPRPSSRQRGYTAAWSARSRAFLAAHPHCLDCGRRATQADHAPRSRAELVASGIVDPDADEHLQPRCASCHSRRTVAVDGGLGRLRVEGGGTKCPD